LKKSHIEPIVISAYATGMYSTGTEKNVLSTGAAHFLADTAAYNEERRVLTYKFDSFPSLQKKYASLYRYLKINPLAIQRGEVLEVIHEIVPVEVGLCRPIAHQMLRPVLRAHSPLSVQGKLQSKHCD
jgi:hypothetical protein